MSNYTGCMACHPNPHVAALTTRCEGAEAERDALLEALEGLVEHPLANEAPTRAVFDRARAVMALVHKRAKL